MQRRRLVFYLWFSAPRRRRRLLRMCVIRSWFLRGNPFLKQEPWFLLRGRFRWGWSKLPHPCELFNFGPDPFHWCCAAAAAAAAAGVVGNGLRILADKLNGDGGTDGAGVSGHIKCELNRLFNHFTGKMASEYYANRWRRSPRVATTTEETKMARDNACGPLLLVFNRSPIPWLWATYSMGIHWWRNGLVNAPEKGQQTAIAAAAGALGWSKWDAADIVGYWKVLKRKISVFRSLLQSFHGFLSHPFSRDIFPLASLSAVNHLSEWFYEFMQRAFAAHTTFRWLFLISFLLFAGITLLCKALLQNVGILLHVL